VPKLWNDTIEEHRRAVRDALLDATAALVAQHGPASVTMSQIAAEAGIGRATLYKYFPDVGAILTAWHRRQVAEHLALLTEARDGAEGTPAERLRAVLDAFATASRWRHHDETATLLHRDEHVAHALAHLKALVRDLVAEGAEAGELRGDVDAGELAAYCLHALTAAGALTSKAAVGRLVDVTLAGLRP